MSVDPLFCRYCGRVNPSIVSFCIHCNRFIAHPRVPGNTLSAPEQKRGITRRTALLGLVGAVGAIALGGGAGIWYASTASTQTSRPQLLTYTGHRSAPITALTWSPDGNYIASGDANGTLLIWDTSTGETLLICREPATKSVSSVSWASDGTSILAGYINMLVIWDAQSGKAR
jgi:hypothetical protein